MVYSKSYPHHAYWACLCGGNGKVALIWCPCFEMTPPQNDRRISQHGLKLPHPLKNPYIVPSYGPGTEVNGFLRGWGSFTPCWLILRSFWGGVISKHGHQITKVATFEIDHANEPCLQISFSDPCSPGGSPVVEMVIEEGGRWGARVPWWPEECSPLNKKWLLIIATEVLLLT